MIYIQLLESPSFSNPQPCRFAVEIPKHGGRDDFRLVLSEDLRGVIEETIIITVVLVGFVLVQYAFKGAKKASGSASLETRLSALETRLLKLESEILSKVSDLLLAGAPKCITAVFIKTLTGKSFSIDVELTDTVDSIKSKIAYSEGIPPINSVWFMEANYLRTDGL